MENEIIKKIKVSISEDQTITELSKVIQKYNSEILLKKLRNGTVYEINLKSFLGLVTLQLENGDEITVKAIGPDGEEAIEKVIDFLT